MKDYQRPIEIDYSILGAAQSYYQKAGFQKTAVPWVIDIESGAATLPEGAQFNTTLGGGLVGSAEQSFMHMLRNGWDEPGAYQATTPCFRDENHDELHYPYFMKNELFDNENVTEKRLYQIIDIALNFFNSLVPGLARVEDMKDGTFDIVGKKTGLELGSYGIRQMDEHTWIYATGVALPRFEQVVQKEGEQ